MSDTSDSPKIRVPLSALRPLLPIALRYKSRIWATLTALIVASAATLVLPKIGQKMIDEGFSKLDPGSIHLYFGAMFVTAAVVGVASGARYYCVMTLGERVVADLRDALFRHLTKLDAQFFDTAKTGELLSRLTSDTTQIRSAFGASASIALRNFILLIGAIIAMILTSPKLSGLMLVAIPMIVLPLVMAGRSVRGRARKAQDALAEASAYAAENLGAMRTMQAFNAQKTAAQRFFDAAENAYDTARQAIQARAYLTAGAFFLASAAVVGVLWLGARDVLSGQLTDGTLTQFILYAIFAASSLGQLSEVWREVSAAAGAASRIGEIMAIVPRISAPLHPVALPAPQGKVAFRDVSFSYPSRVSDVVVHDISFAVQPGETVAIVGPSGAGKSTLFQLLMRFYDPSAGMVRVDETDIRTVDPDALRARIALVPQEPVIFGASIADNIRYGRPDASDDDVRAAAARANADDFIRQMPQGYATRVGERGVTLSGGQRQRIAIARAILKDAPILLLDEATSALDAENETIVQQALEGLMQNRTTLVIAHRLATVLSADRILVMDGGRIVEEGTHTSLVAQNGLYARLAKLQFETGAAALV